MILYFICLGWSVKPVWERVLYLKNKIWIILDIKE